MIANAFFVICKKQFLVKGVGHKYHLDCISNTTWVLLHFLPTFILCMLCFYGVAVIAKTILNWSLDQIAINFVSVCYNNRGSLLHHLKSSLTSSLLLLLNICSWCLSSFWLRAHRPVNTGKQCNLVVCYQIITD